MRSFLICCSSDITKIIKTRRVRWVGQIAHMGLSNTYTILVGKPERKRPLGRPRRRWEDTVNMDATETGWEGVNWVNLGECLD
jgi:hypothetical protein